MAKKRPRIKIPLSQQDVFIEILTGLLILLMWGFFIKYYPSLPDQVPHHYNSSGEADSYGSKYISLVLPCMATILYALLYFIKKIPHHFNYLTAVTPQNAWTQYSSAVQFLRWLKLFITVLFTYLTYKVMTLSNHLGSWFVPITLALVVFTLVFSITKAIRK